MIEARITNTNYEYGVLFMFMNRQTDYALRMLRALTDENSIVCVRWPKMNKFRKHSLTKF